MKLINYRRTEEKEIKAIVERFDKEETTQDKEYFLQMVSDAVSNLYNELEDLGNPEEVQFEKDDNFEREFDDGGL